MFKSFLVLAAMVGLVMSTSGVMTPNPGSIDPEPVPVPQVPPTVE